MRRLVVVLLVIAILGNSSTLVQGTNQCGELLRGIVLNAFEGKLPETKGLLQGFFNSGRDINDLGQPQMCKNMTNYKYMIGFVSISMVRIRVGICGPQECTENDYKSAAQEVRNKYLEFFPQFQKIVIQFNDPEILKDEADFLSYLTFFIWGSFIVLSIIATIKDLVVATQIRQHKIIQEMAAADYGAAQLGDTLLQNTAISQSQQPQISEEQVPRDKGIYQFVGMFSLVRNIKSILKLRDDGDSALDIFNGIRVLAMCWVIYSHEYNSRLRVVTNLQNVTPIFESPLGLFILGGVYAVDVFFFMGSFFFTYIFLGKLSKMKFTPKVYIQTIIYRIYRILPVYALVLLFMYRVMPFLGNGPMWNDYIQVFSNSCKGKWWQNLLFLENYFNNFTDGYCFGWGWYLSNDMQMFLVAPIIAYILHRNQFIGKIVVWFLILCSTVLGMYLSFKYHFRFAVPNFSIAQPFLKDFYDKFYYMPWCRMNVYLLGVLFAVFYKNYKEKKDNFDGKFGRLLESNTVLRRSLLFFGVITIIVIIFVPLSIVKNPNTWGDLESSIFIVFGRCVFLLGIASIVLNGMTKGPDSIICKVFGAKFWLPFVKISFMAYLIHPLIHIGQIFSLNHGFYYNHFNLAYSTFGDLLIIFTVSLFLTAMIEGPIQTIESRYLFPKKKSGKPAINKDDQKKLVAAENQPKEDLLAVRTSNQ